MRIRARISTSCWTRENHVRFAMRAGVAGAATPFRRPPMRSRGNRGEAHVVVVHASTALGTRSGTTTRESGTGSARNQSPACSRVPWCWIACDWTTQDEDSKTQVGDLAETNGGQIRALRFGAVGTLNFARPWTYTVFLVTHAFDQGYNSQHPEHAAVFRLPARHPAGQLHSHSASASRRSRSRTSGSSRMAVHEHAGACRCVRRAAHGPQPRRWC